MRSISILSAILFCASCARHHDFETSEIESLIAVCAELKKNNVVGVIPETDWPKYLRDFGAEQVSVGSDGVYITMSKFFVEESGVFCSQSNALNSSGDPIYKEIADNLYTYVVKG